MPTINLPNRDRPPISYPTFTEYCQFRSDIRLTLSIRDAANARFSPLSPSRSRPPKPSTFSFYPLSIVSLLICAHSPSGSTLSWDRWILSLVFSWCVNLEVVHLHPSSVLPLYLRGPILVELSEVFSFRELCSNGFCAFLISLLYVRCNVWFCWCGRAPSSSWILCVLVPRDPSFLLSLWFSVFFGCDRCRFVEVQVPQVLFSSC